MYSPNRYDTGEPTGRTAKTMASTNGAGAKQNGPDDGTCRPFATNGEDLLSLDAILSLLANDRRRDVLAYLVETDDDVTSIEDLVAHLVEAEGERTGELPSHDNVEATLFNVHIPKLADATVVEYDERSRQLRYWSNERLEHWVALVEDEKSD